MRPLKWFTTVLGIGYVEKGGGTIAALLTCVIWWLLKPGAADWKWELWGVIAVSALAVWAGSRMEPEWGKDSSRIVVDEVTGMWIALIGFGVTLPRILLAFTLFRFFDIAKPLFIRKLERLPGGWGVVMDDALAGLYANLILQFLIAVDRI